MRKNIFQGPTFQGQISFLGLVIIIAGAFLAIKYNVALGVLLAGLGVFFFLNMKGTIIDQKKGIVKPYFIFLFFKLGKQYDLIDFNKITIATCKDAVRMNSRGSSGEYRTKTYDVSIINSSDTKILLKQFPKKKQAEVFQEEMKKMLELL
jgi:hypothetical protein